MNRQQIQQQVKAALAEDIGNGDLTAQLLPARRISAQLICREAAVLAGQAWFEQAILSLDPQAQLHWSAADGDAIAANQIIVRIEAENRALLSAERTALNFLQTLSATATLTARYVAQVADLPVRLLDTRKTLPGLRLAQKYAVRCGGGHNHRIGLFDAVLIKENHIAAAGSIAAVMEQALALYPDKKIEIEVENLDELEQALSAGARFILLDNFNLDGLRQAVALNRGRANLEASGNVNLDTVRDIALTGVNDISIGELTKNIQAIDFSLLIEGEV